MAKHMYEGASVFIQFGKAPGPFRTAKCRGIKRHAVTNKKSRYNALLGGLHSATDYKVQIGGEWGYTWHRLWLSERDGYMVHCEREWCPVQIEMKGV